MGLCLRHIFSLGNTTIIAIVEIALNSKWQNSSLFCNVREVAFYVKWRVLENV